MTWQLWIIIAIFLLITEVFTTTFFFISLATGALGASLASLFGSTLEIQLLLAAVFTLVSFVWAKPILQKFSKRHLTNTDALIGQHGRVSERIDAQSGTGRVKVGGDDWKAVSTESALLEPGVQVEIIRVDSTILHVKPI
jgi:membrane protein implicated in regulation of membrane protease activity